MNKRDVFLILDNGMLRKGVTEGADTSKRIDAAFATLRESGLLAQRGYQCCSSCGFDAAEAAMTRDHVGAAFIHAQGEEHLTESDVAYINFGANPQVYMEGEREELHGIVGDLVANALVAAGLTVEWDADPKHAIRVLGLRALAAEATRSRKSGKAGLH